MHRNDLFSRVVGILVFLGGIAVLVVVFVLAHAFFTSQAGQIRVSAPAGAPGSATTALGQSAIQILAQILALLVMAIAGSLIAGRGIQLYFSSRGGAGRAETTQE